MKIAKTSLFSSFFGSPQLGQATGAGPWLLSGVKAEPVQVAEPPGSVCCVMAAAGPAPGTGPGTGHRWRLQVAKPSPGLSFLQGCRAQGARLGSPLPGPRAWGGQGCEDQPPSPSHAAQPCPALASPAVGTFHTGMPFTDRAGCHSQGDGDTGHLIPAPV